MAPLSRISDVTAIWNTNAFWAYLMNVRLHNAKVQMLKLSAVLLACVGVLFVVYGGQSASSGSALSSPSTPTNQNATRTSGGSAPLIGDLLSLIASVGYAAYQVLYKRFVSLPSDPDESISAPIPPLSPLSSTRAGYEPLLTDDDALILSSQPSRTHPPAASDESTLPFGLYPNLLTSAIGVATFIALWPLLMVLHWSGAEKFTLPADARIWAGIAGIALGGVTFNAGYMVRCVSI
jgi:drug/metabolite transporter (DMT)-like permease